MKFTIIAVGKLKEKYIATGINDYMKRLTPHAKLNIVEVKDSPLPNKMSDAEIERVIKEEGKRIKRKLSGNEFTIALDSKGKQLTSEEFAHYIQFELVRGRSHFTFLIGGTLGLSKDLKKEANLVLSFSKFTFPHQLMRLILVEQLYRITKIINNEPYHY